MRTCFLIIALLVASYAHAGLEDSIINTKKVGHLTCTYGKLKYSSGVTQYYVSVGWYVGGAAGVITALNPGALDSLIVNLDSALTLMKSDKPYNIVGNGHLFSNDSYRRRMVLNGVTTIKENEVVLLLAWLKGIDFGE